jgi:hypothetical protein
MNPATRISSPSHPASAFIQSLTTAIQTRNHIILPKERQETLPRVARQSIYYAAQISAAHRVTSGDDDLSLSDAESSSSEDLQEPPPASGNRSRISKIWDHGDERLLDDHPHWCCSHCTFTHGLTKTTKIANLEKAMQFTRFARATASTDVRTSGGGGSLEFDTLVKPHEDSQEPGLS